MPCYLHTDVSDASPGDYLSPLLHSVAVDRFHVTAVSDVGLLDVATIAGLKQMHRERAQNI